MRAKSRIGLLAAFALTSTACSIPLDVTVTVDCVVFTEQRADQATKDWLASHADDAPLSADHFFKRVADNSEKFDRYCKGAPVAPPDEIGATP